MGILRDGDELVIGGHAETKRLPVQPPHHEGRPTGSRKGGSRQGETEGGERSLFYKGRRVLLIASHEGTAALRRYAPGGSPVEPVGRSVMRGREGQFHGAPVLRSPGAMGSFRI